MDSPELDPAAFTELAAVTALLEAALYDSFAGLAFPDPGWPGLPRLDQHTDTSAEQFVAIIARLRNALNAE